MQGRQELQDTQETLLRPQQAAVERNSADLA